MVSFPLFKPPSFTYPLFLPVNQVIVGGYVVQRQLQIGVSDFGRIDFYRHIKTPRDPLSLKRLARNVLLKHRPHKDWVEFCSYPKEFRDALINPLMIKIITPQLL